MTPRHLDATFAALADPTRRAILSRLALGETSVNELAKPFDMSLPAVSKHLKVLENAGVVPDWIEGHCPVPDGFRESVLSFEGADVES